jgi:hypothetical protein
MTTNELINELNNKGYVVVLFNHSDWTVEDEKPIPIGYIQSQIDSFYTELDDTFGDIMETIYNDDWYE